MQSLGSAILRVCESASCESASCESASCESASCESASLRVANLRVASLRVCELRVCELRVCELRVCEFTVGIYCLESSLKCNFVCFDNCSYILYFDRSFHSKKCSRFTFSNFSNFGGKMTSSFWRQYFV
jgi:hypothetical protein